MAQGPDGRAISSLKPKVWLALSAACTEGWLWLFLLPQAKKTKKTNNKTKQKTNQGAGRLEQ